MPELLEPADLEARLDAPGMTVVQIVEAASYEDAHIPGAIHVHPAELVCGIPPATGRLPDPGRLNELFSRLGHRPDRTYVLADDEGGGWAGRFAWTLDVVGHHRWSYLNGGIHGWRATGRPIERGIGPSPASIPVSVHVDTAPVATADELLSRLDDPDLLIWDVRSPEEYEGARSGARRAGHIPGAVNLDWMLLKDHANATRLPERLAQLLADAGIDRRRDIVTHCQTHHRSGLSYMIARLLGFDRIRAYDGSWSEWGNRDDTPVRQGARP